MSKLVICHERKIRLMVLNEKNGEKESIKESYRGT
jgi:hypothetical protein